MELQKRITAFSTLGHIIETFLETAEGKYADALCIAEKKAITENPWFTKESVRNALQAIVCMLEEENLRDWVKDYELVQRQKTVACILAGNIPLVGFHDMLCVSLSGHSFVGKLSRKDSQLLPVLSNILQEIQPDMKNHIHFVSDLQGVGYDAVIATGSNNTARYFQHYFAKKPHVIRKGRSSVAILKGDETSIELQGLADDIFMYFGLGCRNVSKIFLPAQYDIRSIFPEFEKYCHYKQHHKWMNNYEYNRSVHLLNKSLFLDTGFALFKEDLALISPIGMVYYEYYNSFTELSQFLKLNQELIQCIVSRERGKDFVSLGKAQYPHLADYADGVDTMAFLTQLI